MSETNGTVKQMARTAPRAQSKHTRMLESKRKEQPKSVVQMVTAVESDYQFKLGYLTIEALITSNPVRVVGTGGDNRTAALVANLQQHFNQSLPFCVRAFAYGWAPFEKTYARVDGLLQLDCLDPLPIEYAEMVIEPGGEYGGIRLNVPDKPRLMPQETWWFALDPTSLEPFGRSRYNGAPLAVYKRRAALDEQENIWYDRFAIGHAVARFPEPTGPEQEREETAPGNVMAARVAEVESGGVMLLSSAQYVGSDGTPNGTYQYDYEQSEGLRDGTALATARTTLDAAVLRSIGVPERAVTQDTEVGSMSMAEAHQKVLYATCDGVMEQIVNSFKRYVADKCVELNWPGGTGPTIELKWVPLRVQAQQQPKSQPQPQPQPQFARTLAINPPPDVHNESQAADALIARIAAKRADMAAAIESGDRGRL